jgi:HD-like signal output (HDOD) protein
LDRVQPYIPQKGTFVHHGRWYHEFVTHVRLVCPSAACEDLCNRVDAKIRDGAFKVPVLPETAQEVLWLSRDPDASLDRIVRLIERDAAIAVRLLALANSPMFRGQSAFRSGKEAVVRLGLKTVRDLVMQAVVAAKVFDVPAFLPRMKALRADATGVAFASRAIMAVASRKDEWAFMAGLLHDLGEVILLGLVAGERGWEAVPAAAVDELLELRHAAVGAVVAERMNLPEPVVDAIALHHDFTAARPEHLLPALVGTGDLLWRAARVGRLEDRVAFVTAPALSELDIDAASADQLVDEMAGAVPTCQALG